ncbi:nucleotidyltransferase family protein [Leptospira meyeri]|uniref:nucleotidyltransferase family protein n=1 Tax=Leptospira meyeri TaxID=29508 RepID=UPI000C2A9DFF|nr:nucleotidyltransferase family protein [Leptospira meyeri]PJZ79175.1 nucleotidyltransferase [Leptospira meyeri]PJZ95008.1 nucleotidyltransferase [Leptospira meyeri]PKA10466.1 nucleotidyltransferase [Leptospira meyeri]
MSQLNQNQIINFLAANADSLVKFGILHIGLFGSFARNESNSESDIDILVEFIPNQKNFKNYMDLKIFLEDNFNRKIDLVIKDSIKNRIKDQILSETIYAA